MLRQIDQVLELVRIRFVVVKEPRTIQVAHVGVPGRAQGAVFPSAPGSQELTEGSNAPHDGRTAGRIRAAAHRAREVESLDGFWNRLAAQTQQRRHHVLGVDGGGIALRLDAKVGRQAEQHRHARGFLPGPLLALLVVGPKHVAMIRGEDDDGVGRQAGFVERAQQIGEAIIQRRAVRVVAREILAGPGLRRGGHVGRQFDFLGRIQRAVFRRGGLIRIMRRPPREPEEEGLLRLRVVAQIRLGVAGLRDGVVAFPLQFFRAVRVVGRVVVGVRAFENLPVIEALPALARDERRAAAVPVDVPLADAARVVASGLENLWQRHGIRAERHVVQKNAVRLRPLPREQRGARGGTHRHARDSLGEVHGCALEAIQVRRVDVRIAREAEGLRPPLVGDDEEDVGSRGLVRRAKRLAPREGERDEYDGECGAAA